jgi:hypothetical protein
MKCCKLPGCSRRATWQSDNREGPPQRWWNLCDPCYNKRKDRLVLPNTARPRRRRRAATAPPPAPPYPYIPNIMIPTPHTVTRTTVILESKVIPSGGTLTFGDRGMEDCVRSYDSPPPYRRYQYEQGEEAFYVIRLENCPPMTGQCVVRESTAWPGFWKVELDPTDYNYLLGTKTQETMFESCYMKPVEPRSPPQVIMCECSSPISAVGACQNPAVWKLASTRLLDWSTVVIATYMCHSCFQEVLRGGCMERLLWGMVITLL